MFDLGDLTLLSSYEGDVVSIIYSGTLKAAVLYLAQASGCETGHCES